MAGIEGARTVSPDELKALGAMAQNAQPNTMLQQLGVAPQPPAPAPSMGANRMTALTQFLQQLLGKQAQDMNTPNPVQVGIRG